MPRGTPVTELTGIGPETELAADGIESIEDLLPTHLPLNYVAKGWELQAGLDLASTHVVASRVDGVAAADIPFLKLYMVRGGTVRDRDGTDAG